MVKYYWKFWLHFLQLLQIMNVLTVQLNITFELFDWLIHSFIESIPLVFSLPSVVPLYLEAIFDVFYLYLLNIKLLTSSVHLNIMSFQTSSIITKLMISMILKLYLPFSLVFTLATSSNHICCAFERHKLKLVLLHNINKLITREINHKPCQVFTFLNAQLIFVNTWFISCLWFYYFTWFPLLINY